MDRSLLRSRESRALDPVPRVEVHVGSRGPEGLAVVVLASRNDLVENSLTVPQLAKLTGSTIWPKVPRVSLWPGPSFCKEELRSAETLAKNLRTLYYKKTVRKELSCSPHHALYSLSSPHVADRPPGGDGDGEGSLSKTRSVSR